MLIFYCLILLCKTAALLFPGMLLGSSLYAGMDLLENLLLLPLCGAMWLMGKMFHFLMGKPEPFLLTTPLRKALCAILILAWGIIAGMQF